MPAPLHILALGFLTPWLMAAGAAATSIPIIIHLLNKRKFRVVIWAAMDFLLAAQRRNARRLRFQRWLLLAVRCLAILVIAAGIAQLFLQSRALGGLFAEQRAIVLIWDDSYSMGYAQGAGGAATGPGSAFERSRRMVGDYISKLRPSDKLLLVRASRISAQNAPPPQPTLDHASVLTQVRTATLTDANTNLPTAFEQAAQALKDLESTARVRQVLVLTDFSSSSIHAPPTGIYGPAGISRTAGPATAPAETTGERLKQAVEAVQRRATEFRILDVGDPQQSNVGITDVRSRRPAVVAGAPADFDITVFNATDRPLLDFPVSVFLDGVPTQSVRISRIEPNATGAALVRDLAVTTPGRHLLEARLPADGLPTDDLRRLLINARREVPVLLVDGRPGGGGATDYDSVSYLWTAYSLPQSANAASVFAPRMITEVELPTTPLNAYDVVVLSDTSVPGPAQREALKKYVQSGGLLMIFPGVRTNAAAMNDALGNAPGGAGILPATLGQPVKAETAEQQAEGFSFAPEGYTHPVLQVFQADIRQGKNVGFEPVHTTQYFKLGIPADVSSWPGEVILRYARPDRTPGDPAVVKGNYGKGQVVLFASTADIAWNTFGPKPAFVPFIHELTYYAMGRDFANGGTAASNLRLGDSLRLPAESAPAGTWIGPRDSRITVSSELDKDGRAMLVGPPLTQTGTYTPPATTGGANDARPAIAVNADPEEVDIRHVTDQQFAAALGIDPKLIVEQPTAIADVAVATSDEGASILGPGLVITALGLFLLETVLAMVFSTYR
jgi:hypothetical protein